MLKRIVSDVLLRLRAFVLGSTSDNYRFMAVAIIAYFVVSGLVI